MADDKENKVEKRREVGKVGRERRGEDGAEIKRMEREPDEGEERYRVGQTGERGKTEINVVTLQCCHILLLFPSTFWECVRRGKLSRCFRLREMVRQSMYVGRSIVRWLAGWLSV